MSTGRDEGVPLAVEGRLLEAEKRLSFEFKIWSRSFRSSFAEIISAAAPFGHLIMGMTPEPLAEFPVSVDDLTHGGHNTKEATDNSVYNIV